jgi:hypothetical protein
VLFLLTRARRLGFLCLFHVYVLPYSPAEGAEVASHRDAVDLCWMLLAAGHVTLESCVLLDKKYPTSLTGHKFFKVAEGHPHGASKQEKNRITKRCN